MCTREAKAPSAGVRGVAVREQVPEPERGDARGRAVDRRVRPGQVQEGQLRADRAVAPPPAACEAEKLTQRYPRNLETVHKAQFHYNFLIDDLIEAPLEYWRMFLINCFIEAPLNYETDCACPSRKQRQRGPLTCNRGTPFSRPSIRLGWGEMFFFF